MHPILDPRVHNIIHEARLRFITDGYAAARIEPIARAAGVSTATLYNFFSSKNALFEAVVETAAQELYDRVGPILESGTPSRDLLTDYLTRYTEFLSDSFVRKMFRLILSERPRFNEKAVAFFDKGRGDIALHLISMVEVMNEQGMIKVEKPSWAVSQLLGMIEYPVLLLPLASAKDPIKNRSARDLAEDAVATFWARYGT